ncbi:hypothetical protein WK57_24630 [Burkholderia ubonensis]|uniref:Uncharacterized protein n=1 Tax=Burkholderia ubonensis TaxID=101571 RepID=A0AA40R420_9BURK|nr:hypothetical protein WK64_12895 [Burkholderia ubonensis]KWB46670.1 hypothetical protein WL36_13215 [Burkholderia ubonensis]KWZ52296.1 hypothetical protein WK57_24630 [Burkholderia ubonensis]
MSRSDRREDGERSQVAHEHVRVCIDSFATDATVLPLCKHDANMIFPSFLARDVLRGGIRAC